jgi:hypothetical protein
MSDQLRAPSHPVATLRRTLDLARLVDLEIQLHRDEAAQRAGREAELQTRDANVGAALLAELGVNPQEARARLATDAAWRQRVATAFVDAVVPPAERHGEPVDRAVRRSALAMTVLGVLVGAFAAAATLAYSGQAPVNVFVFLGALILPQVALLLLLLWAASRARGGVLGGALAALARTRWFGGAHSAQLGAVGARLGLHADAERWVVFSLAQRTAVAFNAGALLTCLWLVAVTDLAFGWSTTLQVTPQAVQSACAAIATPWRWAWPEACPDAALVRASQWVRMPGRFLGGESLHEAVARSGRWWTFLVASLVVWGLLPRLLAWTYGAWRSRRALARVRLDDRRCTALFDRLIPATLWDRPDARDVGLPANERVGTAAAPPTAAVSRTSTWLLCWGRTARRSDDVSALVARQTGAPPHGVLPVGGADLADDERAVRTLTGARAERVLLVATAGSQPTKEIVTLLRDLRRGLGAHAHLAVALLGEAPQGELFAPDDDELAAWRVRLDREADPNLGVERLAVTS